MPAFTIDQNFYDLIFRAVFHATKAVTAFLQRDSVLYWPFLISTLAIAWIAWRYYRASTNPGARKSWRSFCDRHLGRSLWWHPSARVDYRYYIINAIVFPLLIGPFLFGDTTVVNLVNGVLGLTPGTAAGSVPVNIAATVFFTLAFFIAYDFGRFVAHSLLHDVPFLWEFHKVHHSAEVLTPFTTFRAHPIDLLLMAWGGALATGLVTWLFHRYVNSGITFHTFLGLHVLIWAFSLIGNLRHSQVWLSYGKTLNRWLISPAHHQLHHSAEERHWGCNRGFELAIWDRMYGTLCVPSDEPEEFRFGLGDETDGKWRSVGRLYFWPFVLLIRGLQ